MVSQLAHGEGCLHESCVLWLPHSPVSEQPVWIAHIVQKTGDLAINQLGHLNEWRSENYKPGLQQVEKKMPGPVGF